MSDILRRTLAADMQTSNRWILDGRSLVTTVTRASMAVDSSNGAKKGS